MIKQKWDKYWIKLKVSTIIRKWNHKNTDEEHKMNPEYYIHLL